MHDVFTINILSIIIYALTQQRILRRLSGIIHYGWIHFYFINSKKVNLVLDVFKLIKVYNGLFSQYQVLL